MAFEIIENNREEKVIFLAGIMTNGLVVAKQLKKTLELHSHMEINLIEVKLNKKEPLHCEINDLDKLKDQIVILVDDVINSGKTLLYAMIPILQISPRKIETLTLVERSYKTFPVHADYVGISLASTLQDHIHVEVSDEKIIGAFLD
jgi:pyrimidine operon attenuation protein/uracil phosphoribosyltransferase